MPALGLLMFAIAGAAAGACPAPEAETPSGGAFADEGAAYAACMADGAGVDGKSIGGYIRTFTQCKRLSATVFAVEVKIDVVNGTCKPNFNSGTITTFGNYGFTARCAARPEEFGWEGGGTAASVNACHNGCMYTSSLDASGTAGVSFAPTGGTCTESDAPAPTPAGDGGDPGGGDGGGTDPGGGDGGGDNGGGDGGGGTDPGGGDGGGGTGPGDGDGGGDDGGGDGGGGTGPGPGPGPGEGDGDGPGQPGGDGDALYESEGKTVEKLYDDFAERVSKAPIIDATKSFFEISVSASCPIFTFPATPYWDAMTFDFLCKPEIVAILQLLGWLLLAFAAFHAIKIALT
ncbi:TPA: hypothetical protein ACKPXO_002260 [Stenotrophomonas maltophilia]